jgi:hypothetical protein
MKRQAEEDEEETTEAAHARLAAQVAAKRRLEEIESMRAEIAGEIPENPVRIEGTSLPIRKRSATILESPSKQPRLDNPPNFHGKSLKELQTFKIA